MTASIADQREVLYILRSLETSEELNVRERDLVIACSSIEHPSECVTELIATGHVYRVKAPSGDFIRRTEK